VTGAPRLCPAPQLGPGRRQQVLDLLAEVVMHPVGSRVTVVRRKGLWSLPRRSGWLIEAIKTAYTRLGLGEVIGVTGLLSRWSPLV